MSKPINKKSVNRTTPAIFAPVLILVGVTGFLIPAQYSLTSGAPPYNVFHLIFESVALIVLWSAKERLKLASSTRDSA